MSFATHPAAAPRALAQRKPSRLLGLVSAVVEARTRMSLAAVTNPATGQIDPVLERRVLRTMAL